MLVQSFNRVLRACRREAARWWRKRGYATLVEAYRKYEYAREYIQGDERIKDVLADSFADVLEQTHNAFLYTPIVFFLVGKPDECYMETFTLGKRAKQQRLVLSICFTDAPLREIAAYCVVKVTLCNTHKHLYRRLVSIPCNLPIYRPDGINRKRVAFG